MSDEHLQDDDKIVDNRGWLPKWWEYMMYGSIVFALVYGLIWRPLGGSEHRMNEEYMGEKKLVEANKAKAVEAMMGSGGDTSGFNPLRGNADAIATGEGLFASKGCFACHGQGAAGGAIGPSLMDGEWLYGTTDEVVFDVIANGRMDGKLGKGPMPPQGGTTSEIEIKQILAWIASNNETLKAE